MSAFTKSRVRIAFDLSSRESAVDAITAKMPSIWAGNDIQFELAGLFNSALIDVSSVTAYTLEIKPYPTITGTALFTGTISAAATTISQADWTAGTAQQFLVPMTAAQSAIDLLGGTSRECWLVVRATCGSTVFTLGATKILVLEDGH